MLLDLILSGNIILRNRYHIFKNFWKAKFEN